MAEIWGAAIMVGGSVISGMAASKKAKQDKKDSKEMTLEGAKFEAMQSEFNAGQDYYYNQLNRQNKQRGLAEFRKFSTMNKFAPQYTQTNAGVVVPDKPSAATAFAAPGTPGSTAGVASISHLSNPTAPAVAPITP